MAYVLGYITADGCICVRKDRKKHPYTLNITSAKKTILYKIRKTLGSEHKISKKPNGRLGGIGYQLQISNPIITKDLMLLGILPRKTSNLWPINVPDKYLSDFVRGFFDGDGSIYIYKVNRTLQIKSSFVSSSLPFITNFNQRLCKELNIPKKSIHKDIYNRKKPLYVIHLYIDDSEKLYQFMYKNKPELYLDRKYQIFKKWESIKRRHYKKQDYPSKIGWYLNQNLYSQV